MNRRELLAAAGGVGVGSGAGRATASSADGRIADDLARYVGFGAKQSGGAGDRATGAWLEGRLAALGFATARQGFAAPFFNVARAELRVGDAVLPLRPQAPWRLTAPGGVEGRLQAWPGDGDAQGAIVVVTLPYRRWSSFKAREVEPPVRAALAAGAAAVLVVTTGPSGEALALNVALDAAPFPAPVAVLSPTDAAAIAPALRARAPARVTVTGELGQRPAFTVAGRLDRGARRWLVVSTPRSGWDVCAGERGPGVAVWLDLAAWAAWTLPHLNVLMTSASGHEREYAGAKLFLRGGGPPPPERTALWLHLGANVAARDWHELPGGLRPLPSADPQRVLSVAGPLLPAARAAFRGLPGLEAPYAESDVIDGELGDIVAAGYRRSAGVFGAHRFHHALGDDARCLAPGIVEAAAAGFRRFAAAALQSDPGS